MALFGTGVDGGATTLCGTDLRIVTGQKTHGVTPGVILGHEIAARVWKLGADLRPGIDAPAPGTQVGLAPEITCGHCVPCTAGRSNVCANMALFGTGVDGGVQQRYATTLQFNSLRVFSVNNVQRNADAYNLISFYSLEVDVLNFAAEWVHLEVTHDNVFSFTVQRQFDQSSMERFFFQCVEYSFVVYSNSSTEIRDHLAV